MSDGIRDSAGMRANWLEDNRPEPPKVEIVDRQQAPKPTWGRRKSFWDSTWAQIETLPPNKSVRLSLSILNAQAPEVLYERRFGCGAWAEIKAQLDRRARKAGLWRGASPLRHSWSHTSIRESEYVDVWLEGGL